MEKFKIKIGNEEREVKLEKVADGEYRVYHDESIYEVSILKKVQKEKSDGQYRKENGILYFDSAIGGIVLSLKKNVGDKVSKGDPIMTLIAMKMETEIIAPVAGILSKIPVNEGMIIEKGELLFELEVK